jgi:two-component system CheB/CheR fusion protein
VLLKKYMPASVLVNKDMEILRFRGAVSKYLEPATGKASLHLMKMVKEELLFDLRSVITQGKKRIDNCKKTRPSIQW